MRRFEKPLEAERRMWLCPELKSRTRSVMQEFSYRKGERRKELAGTTLRRLYPQHSSGRAVAAGGEALGADDKNKGRNGRIPIDTCLAAPSATSWSRTRHSSVFP